MDSLPIHSPNRLEPTVETVVVNDGYKQFQVRAKVNKHEPDIILYLIDAGMKFFVSENRTGIGGIVSGHRRRADAEKKALRIVGQRFREVEKAASQRTRLYG